MRKLQIPSNLLSKRLLLRVVNLSTLFLLIEFFDELHYGIQNAVLPAFRSDLHLTYAQIGLLLGLPAIISTVVEPLILLLGDTPLRKKLVIGGGLVIVMALLLTAAAQSFPVLLLAFIIAFPASGAFVSLSQATLMDLNPGRESQGMARWTAAGSLGNVLGPLIIAGAFAISLGWRWVYLFLAISALFLTAAVARSRFPTPKTTPQDHPANLRSLIKGLFRNVRDAIRKPLLIRWTILLELSDLLLDIFTGYMVLYFSDVVGLTTAQTGLLLTVTMLASLVSDLLVIPLLERIPGRNLVRLSAALIIPVYILWLLVPSLMAKIILVILIRFLPLGWHQVLKGEAYASVPGRSGTVSAITSLAGILGGAMTAAIGWVANQAGIEIAMWPLLIGPIALILFVPPPDKQDNRHTAGSG